MTWQIPDGSLLPGLEARGGPLMQQGQLPLAGLERVDPGAHLGVSPVDELTARLDASARSGTSP